MSPICNISLALLVAALSVSPALAAQNTTTMKPQASATTTTAAATTEQWQVMMPVATLIKDVGTSTPDLLTTLGSATTIRVIHAKAEYTALDQKSLNAALTTRKADLDKFHAALRGDLKLKDVFSKNKLDPNNVIAIIPNKSTTGTVDVVVM